MSKWRTFGFHVAIALWIHSSLQLNDLLPLKYRAVLTVTHYFCTAFFRNTLISLQPRRVFSVFSFVWVSYYYFSLSAYLIISTCILCHIFEKYVSKCIRVRTMTATLSFYLAKVSEPKRIFYFEWQLLLPCMWCSHGFHMELIVKFSLV